MERYKWSGTVSVHSLREHQRIIERSLADFSNGRKTAHLPAEEVDLVIRALEERLETIKQSLARGPTDLKATLRPKPHRERKRVC